MTVQTHISPLPADIILILWRHTIGIKSITNQVNWWKCCHLKIKNQSGVSYSHFADAASLGRVCSPILSTNPVRNLLYNNGLTILPMFGLLFKFMFWSTTLLLLHQEKSQTLLLSFRCCHKLTSSLIFSQICDLEVVPSVMDTAVHKNKIKTFRNLLSERLNLFWSTPLLACGNQMACGIEWIRRRGALGSATRQTGFRGG